MAVRLVAFPMWALLTCWCDLGERYDQEDNFEWSKISFKYKDHARNYLRDRSERSLDLHRSIQQVRRRREQENRVAGQAGVALGQSFAKAFAMTNEMGWCPICTCELDAGSERKVLQLGCNPLHVVHEVCFNDLKKFMEDARKDITCPVCRAIVDQSQIKRLVKYNANLGQSQIEN